MPFDSADRAVLTVLTPTFNRRRELRKLFESLQDQPEEIFTWLVVDDGSTDGTGAAVAEWARKAAFEIQYLHKPNGGKHTAVNAGVDAVRTPFVVIVDSDDWLAAGAVAGMVDAWSEVGNPSAFSDVRGLFSQNGAVVGKAYEADVVDSDAFTARFWDGVHGDRVAVYRVACLREFPFPESWQRKYVTEDLVWFRVSHRYRTRYVNRTWAYKTYAPGGLTDAAARDFFKHSDPLRQLHREIVTCRRPLPRRQLLKAYTRWISLSIHAGRSLREEGGAAPNRLLYALLLPAGLVTALRDRFVMPMRAGRGPRP